MPDAVPTVRLHADVSRLSIVEMQRVLAQCEAVILWSGSVASPIARWPRFVAKEAVRCIITSVDALLSDDGSDDRAQLHLKTEHGLEEGMYIKAHFGSQDQKSPLQATLSIAHAFGIRCVALTYFPALPGCPSHPRSPGRRHARDPV
eukprot:2810150-Rhodomonas_salina.1